MDYKSLISRAVIFKNFMASGQIFNTRRKLIKDFSGDQQGAVAITKKPEFIAESILIDPAPVITHK